MAEYVDIQVKTHVDLSVGIEHVDLYGVCLDFDVDSNAYGDIQIEIASKPDEILCTLDDDDIIKYAKEKLGLVEVDDE